MRTRWFWIILAGIGLSAGMTVNAAPPPLDSSFITEIPKTTQHPSRFIPAVEKYYPNIVYNMHDPDYLEIPDPVIKFNIKGLVAYDIAYKGYLSYTAHQTSPGYKESGTYNVSIKGQVETVVFYRWGKGPAEVTDSALDVYIYGMGFFALKLPWGRLAYTQDGRFSFDNKGRLVHLTWGIPVMGEKGEIFVEDRKLRLDDYGRVFSKHGDIIDKIRIVKFKDLQKLLSFNGSLFYMEDRFADNAVDDYTMTMRQGAYETPQIVKGLVGQVPEWRQATEANVGSAKTVIKGIRSMIQVANP